MNSGPSPEQRWGDALKIDKRDKEKQAMKKQKAKGGKKE